MILRANQSAKADVWKKFMLPEINGTLITSVAICKNCLKGLIFRNSSGRSTGTSNMSNHCCLSAPETKIPKLDSFILKNRKDIAPEDQEMIKEAQTRFVVSTFNSFQILEHPSFINLLKFVSNLGNKYGKLNIDEILYGRHSISAHVDTAYESRKEEIKAEIIQLGQNPALCLTCDIWTDPINYNSFLDLTVFFVDEKFKLRHHLLGFKNMPERHTAENILKTVENICNFYSINHLIAPYVTDSGANVKCAFKEGEWYPCFDHQLHTAISKAWKVSLEQNDQFKILLNQMNDAKAFFHRSSDLESSLTIKIPSSCATRAWTGLHALFNAFESSFDQIESILYTRSNFNLQQILDSLKCSMLLSQTFRQ